MNSTQKKIVIFISICSILLLILIIAILTNKEEFKPTLQEDLNTIQDVCSHYNIEYISEEDIADFDFSKQVLLKFPYDTQTEDSKTTKNYYEDVINALAKVYEYQDIIVLDDSKALKIEIESNKDMQILEKYKINGDENYFSNLESKLNLAKKSNLELKEMTVNSSILKDLIKNSWNVDKVNFGSKETDLKDYEIYFEEGLQVRKIAGKVFNIVFTDKYNGNIVDEISTKSTLEQIKSKYGNSSFEETGNFVGYKTKDFYIFFGEGQVSVYRVETYDTKEFAKLFTTFSQTKEENYFKDDLMQLWPDYDNFYQNELTGEIELTYTLKGVKFNINMSNEHGLALYSNFNGQITDKVSYEQILDGSEQIPDYVYVKTENLVYINESNRLYDIYNNAITSENYTYMYYDALDKNLGDSQDLTQTDFANPSSKFFCLKENGTLRVFSYDNTYAPFEIKNNYCFIWADDTHLVYSKNKQGIFVYDAITREVKTLVSGKDEYEIISYLDGNIKYDDKSIEYKVK